MTDIHSCSYFCDRPECIKAQRDELRDKLAQQEQEPNYWLGYGLQAHTEKPFEGATPFHTTPPQRTWVGLTDEEIELLDCVYLNWLDYERVETKGEKEFARAIESKLKEKNNV